MYYFISIFFNLNEEGAGDLKCWHEEREVKAIGAFWEFVVVGS